MTNTVRILLKAVAVLAITAAFGSASFAFSEVPSIQLR